MSELMVGYSIIPSWILIIKLIEPEPLSVFSEYIVGLPR